MHTALFGRGAERLWPTLEKYDVRFYFLYMLLVLSSARAARFFVSFTTHRLVICRPWTLIRNRPKIFESTLKKSACFFALSAKTLWSTLKRSVDLLYSSS